MSLEVRTTHTDVTNTPVPSLYGTRAIPVQTRADPCRIRVITELEERLIPIHELDERYVRSTPCTYEGDVVGRFPDDGLVLSLSYKT